ncbi:MAG TPA: hypothetical protein VEI50_03385 [Nitrospiraceae bacterium]|nr:hypothetical protein [Nitrospiraceae bacterium]
MLLPQTPAIGIALSGLYLVTVFALDVITPLGVPVWLLYGGAFFFLYKHPAHFYVVVLAAACTFLILIGYLLSPGTQPEPIAERVGAIIIVWVIALVLIRRKQTA